MKSSQLVDHLFRHESAKLKSMLTGYFGIDAIDLVEDIVQDTLLKALQLWPHSMPKNPEAWLYKSAKNAAIDRIRHENVEQKYTTIVSEFTTENDDFEAKITDDQFTDDLLKMTFTACHPKLPVESQIAFALRTLFGFGIKDISEALLISESNVEKRLYRAKSQFRSGKIEFKHPENDEIDARIQSVTHVLYLIFNKGYYSTSSKELYSVELCADAYYYAKQLPKQPSVYGILALFNFHMSRFPARFKHTDYPISLKKQDRHLYDPKLIYQGFKYLKQVSIQTHINQYLIEATISSIHSTTPSYEQTDWKTIHKLYEQLYALTQNEHVRINMIIVRSHFENIEHLIDELKNMKIEKNHSYHLILSDLYEKLNDLSSVKHYLELAKSAVKSERERNYISNKLNELEASI
jgi:RNA polymerase sigma factor (sigma-70 family)